MKTKREYGPYEEYQELLEKGLKALNGPQGGLPFCVIKGHVTEKEWEVFQKRQKQAAG